MAPSNGVDTGMFITSGRSLRYYKSQKWKFQKLPLLTFNRPYGTTKWSKVEVNFQLLLFLCPFHQKLGPTFDDLELLKSEVRKWRTATCAWTLWSTWAFSILVIITKFSLYIMGYIVLIYCISKFVDLMKLWPPQAPNSTIFGACHSMLRAAVWRSQREKLGQLLRKVCYKGLGV